MIEMDERETQKERERERERLGITVEEPISMTRP